MVKTHKEFGLFSKVEADLIEKAISEAESKTSGELVVECVPRSSSYGSFRWMGMCAGIFLGGATALLIERASNYPLLLTEVFGILVAGGLLAYAVLSFDFILRVVVPRSAQERAVERAAVADFFRLGLFETRDRTGVLIFVSIFEHRVRVLADKGIDVKMPPGTWTQEVERVIVGIRKNEAATALVESVRNIGLKMQELFPKRADDINELPNRPT